MDATRSICGIDFSGAQDAGSKIWIAKGVPEGESLVVSECYRAKDLLKSGKAVGDCLSALVKLMGRGDILDLLTFSDCKRGRSSII
jgi:hypothetical protein